MAHFAELDRNNEVIQVVVISNDDVAANKFWITDTSLYDWLF